MGLSRTQSPLALEDVLEAGDAPEAGSPTGPSPPIDWQTAGHEGAPLVLPFAVEGSKLSTVQSSCSSSKAGHGAKWLVWLLLAVVVGVGAIVGVTELVRRVASSASGDPEFEDSSWTRTVANANVSQMNTFSSEKNYYRTGFHFQPKKNWMNDPNGPLFYKGYYHLFYQYNPNDVVWGNIVWGHAVSTDMIHWRYLEPALVPDKWYDIKGVWSGSATILEDGMPVLLYTGSSSTGQLQNMAVPVNSSDPLLLKWVKIAQNPIAETPPGINASFFRDPTTAWKGGDGKWRIVIGSASPEPLDPLKKTGYALLYTSSDFITWTRANTTSLHSVPVTGMWECPDFYPVPVTGEDGLDTSVNGPSVKHVLKVSLDVTKHDYYAVGSYEEGNDTFVPENGEIDAGIGLRYDYGKFYASKTFYDQHKRRRVLWGWINESDSVQQDYSKGWSSVQAIPRKVWLDKGTGTNLIQWPVEEVEALRQKHVHRNDFKLEAKRLKKIGVLRGPQVEVEVVFDIPDLKKANRLFLPTESSALGAQELCSQQAGQETVLGPFGVLVLAAHALREYTAVFYSLVQSGDGSLKVLVCSDQSRSSLAPDLDKTAYGSFLRPDQGETTLSLRILVDHSIVETFAQGGKVSITSRVYPTLALEDEARLYLFNNGSTPIRLLKFQAWQLSNAPMTDFAA